MTASEELRSYVARLQRRLRWSAALRGAAIVAGAALGATVVLTVVINRLAFSTASLWSTPTQAEHPFASS